MQVTPYQSLTLDPDLPMQTVLTKLFEPSVQVQGWPFMAFQRAAEFGNQLPGIGDELHGHLGQTQGCP